MSTSEASDTSAIARAFVDAWNAQDAGRVMRMFADEAVVFVPPLPGMPDSFRGRDQIRRFVDIFLPGFHATLTSLQEAGDTAHLRATVAADALRRIGLDAVNQEDEIVVGLGKVTTFSIRFTEESQIKLQKAIQSGGDVAP